MAKKIRILSTTAGNYGLAVPGNVFTTDDKTALHLVSISSAEIISDEPDESIDVPTTSRIRGASAASSIRSIKYMGAAGDKPGPAEDTTNPYDATNALRNKSSNNKNK